MEPILEEQTDKILVVKYDVYDYFRIPVNVDLDDVYLYYIRYNTLYIQMEEELPIYIFNSERKGEKITSFKKPNETELTYDFDFNHDIKPIKWDENKKCFMLNGEKYKNIKSSPPSSSSSV
jgi:hypothetical protein